MTELAAQNQSKNKSIALIKNVAVSYFDFCSSVLDEKKLKDGIRGKIDGIVYTTTGYDFSDLSYDSYIQLIKILYKINLESFGTISASKKLEELVMKHKERLGVSKEYEDLVPLLPAGVFEHEKVKLMPRQDLEDKIIHLLDEINEIKSGLDIAVATRTLQLAAEKDMFETTLNNISDGVFSIDISGKIVAFNKAMADLTGFSFEEVNKKKADEVIRLFENTQFVSVDKYAPLTEKAIDKNVYSNGNLVLVTRNGTKKNVHLVSSIISEGAQINLRAIVTLKNITKERELENMKIDFVSIAAHELRTPITSLRGYLSLLKDNLEPNMSDENKDYLMKSIVSSDNLYSLMENLLNISRIERGSLEIKKTCVECRVVFNSIRDRFKEVAKNANIELVWENKELESTKILVDATMIAEVLANLIDNAIKYNKPGGKVSVGMYIKNKFLYITVSDNGIGIPQESIPHIFKKFYRVNSTLEQGKKGTGLGLFISKEIVRLHGGDVLLESIEGTGSKFTFNVPLCA